MFRVGRKDKLVVSVVDSGIGIQLKDQKNLFKMFNSINKGGLNSDGIGLGLFICRSIVQEFNGKIVVKSKYEEGAMFTFCFEIDEPSQDSLLKSPSGNSNCISLQKKYMVSQWNLPRRKIIIADDEPFNLQIIMGFMKMLKVPDIKNTVMKCYNGKEVVELIEQSISEGDPLRYGLIITDCSMPIMDGYEECERVRALL